MPADMQLTGMDALRKKMKSLERKEALLQGKALKAGAEPLKGATESHINESDKNHEHLKDHIVVSRTKNDGFGNRHVEVGPDKELAWRSKFLEFGTEHAPPHPFMQPALDESPDEVLENIREVLKSGLNL